MVLFTNTVLYQIGFITAIYSLKNYKRGGVAMMTIEKGVMGMGEEGTTPRCREAFDRPYSSRFSFIRLALYKSLCELRFYPHKTPRKVVAKQIENFKPTCFFFSIL